MLSPRLRTISNFIPQGIPFADIGTDHAFLPIDRILHHTSPRAIACDVSVGSLEKAKKNIAFHHLSHCIETRLGNGLDPIEKGEVGAFVIAGMGGLLIEELIEDSQDKIDQEWLILQPMRAVEELRYYLCHHRFSIIQEELCVEKNKMYHVLLVKRGENEPNYDCSIGSRLIETRHPLLPAFLQRQQAHLQSQLQNLLQGKSTEEKQERIRQEIFHIQKIKEELL